MFNIQNVNKNMALFVKGKRIPQIGRLHYIGQKYEKAGMKAVKAVSISRGEAAIVK